MKISEKTALNLLEKNLNKYYHLTIKEASDLQIFKALSVTAMDSMYEIRQNLSRSARENKSKCVHYLCLEYLLGKTLKSTLINFGVEKAYAKILKERGKNIESVYEIESDAGLGNGGLGRLAACFMDSLATLNYPVVGHGLRYDYGLFTQKIVDGYQTEFSDEWLKTGDCWLVPRRDKACIVKFDYSLSEHIKNGCLVPEYHNATEVEAFPYDMMLSGFDSKSVSVLRLWSAEAKTNLNSKSFSQGEYAKVVQEQNEIEMISKVLYPQDDHIEGKSLRYKQQYFLVSASLQNIISTHLKRGHNLKSLPKYVAVHINDTHPVLCIPEFMRIFMDDYKLSWEDAWDLTTKLVSYTNHTVLPEALETWDEELVRKRTLRIYQIINEIDRRFREDMAKTLGASAGEVIEKMAVISCGRVRMANLAIIGSYKVNGVSALHSEILKNNLFKEFSSREPNKFINITNGISFRRWLFQSNPRQCQFLEDNIGKKFYHDAGELKKLKACVTEKQALKKFEELKFENKLEFSKYISKQQNLSINPESRFDVQVKRIHEYKRQLLNALRIIYLYSQLKSNPNLDVTPQTFIFGGKAAPRYTMAKRIIKLICQLSYQINNDPDVNHKIKVVFLENYSVSIAEKLNPATDVSQQISLSGQEASGTGNMKAVLNGALLMCTNDGANLEILKHCGKSNMFAFGMNTDEVNVAWKKGYCPKEYYDNDERIQTVIDYLNKGFNGESFGDISNYLLNAKGYGDPYMCLADFDAYIKAHQEMDAIYKDQAEWNKRCLLSIAGCGYFSSDRAIEEYATKIWNLKAIK